MNLKTARTLKTGMKVRTDQGEQLDVKQPLSLTKSVKAHRNKDGAEYIWVGTSRGVWPSNRLTLI